LYDGDVLKMVWRILPSAWNPPRGDGHGAGALEEAVYPARSFETVKE
jgi:hypothetical protein